MDNHRIVIRSEAVIDEEMLKEGKLLIGVVNEDIQDKVHKCIEALNRLPDEVEIIIPNKIITIYGIQLKFIGGQK